MMKRKLCLSLLPILGAALARNAVRRNESTQLFKSLTTVIVPQSTSLDASTTYFEGTANSLKTISTRLLTTSVELTHSSRSNNHLSPRQPHLARWSTTTTSTKTQINTSHALPTFSTIVLTSSGNASTTYMWPATPSSINTTSSSFPNFPSKLSSSFFPWPPNPRRPTGANTTFIVPFINRRSLVNIESLPTVTFTKLAPLHTAPYGNLAYSRPSAPPTKITFSYIESSHETAPAKSIMIYAGIMPLLRLGQPEDVHSSASGDYLNISDPTSSTSTTAATPAATPIYNLYKYYGKNMLNKLNEPGRVCNYSTFRLRKNWYRADNRQRQDYLDAASCLHFNLTDHRIVIPGSLFRIDDFIAMNIYNGFEVQFSGLHYHWHRIFLHLYEKVLRDECGYKGPMLYWDFSEFANNITKDPIFNENTSAVGGNGSPRSGGHGWILVDYLGKNISVPAGSGGGCLFDPPLRGSSIRLGKALIYDEDPTKISVYPLPQYSPNSSLNDDGVLQLNSRCLTRDLNYWTAQILNISHVEYDLSCSDFACLHQRTNGATSNYPYLLNLMNAARFSLGGLQLDPFSGPADPIWWLTAANFDRLWAIWQGQDLETRSNQVTGKPAPYDQNSTMSVTLDFPLRFGGLHQDNLYYVANATSTIE